MAKAPKKATTKKVAKKAVAADTEQPVLIETPVVAETSAPTPPAPVEKVEKVQAEPVKPAPKPAPVVRPPAPAPAAPAASRRLESSDELEPPKHAVEERDEEETAAPRNADGSVTPQIRINISQLQA
ncbi:MAG: hypothetical protein ACO1QS_07575, partial [Verrucomicrobiota bacterium]